MHVFKDAKGTAWNLSINCFVIAAVKKACGINLLDLADPESGLMKEVATFPPLLVTFLYPALAEQAKALNISEEDFSRAMSGDAIGEAFDALLEELVLFYPQARRKLLQAVLEKNKEVEQAASEMLLSRLADPTLRDQALAAMDRRARMQIEEALANLGPVAKPLATGSSESAGPLPDSSDFPTPDLTLGEPSSDSPTERGDLIVT